MGKNRSSRPRQTSGNNGGTPRKSDMSIPTGTDTITVLPENEPGAKTTLQANEEKIQEQLNDLYSKIMDLEIERGFLWKQYYNTENHLQELRDNLEVYQTQLNYDQINDLRYQINQTESQLTEDLEKATKVQTEYDETNRQIHTLETGFDTGDNSNWFKDIQTGEDDNEL